jgi:alkylated DNA repair protein (DNA oxidative demethylase)
MRDALFSRAPTVLSPGAFLFPGLALSRAAAFEKIVEGSTGEAPFRRVVTPGGRPLSVAMTNMGSWGWVSDRRGYRYEARDPLSGRSWPPIPAFLSGFARAAATRAGFPGFAPDACLVNLYAPGAKMAPHVDRDEKDFSHPIVSVSLGLSAVFLWGGPHRSDRLRRVPLEDGDVVVWGGPARLFYHGVAPIRPGCHPRWGERRINLTFRKVS